MKRHWIALVAGCGLVFMGGLTVAQDKAKVTLFSLLTEQQRTDFGLNKLGADERRNLDTWATGVVAAVAQPPTIEPQDLEGAIILASDDEVLGKITSNNLDEKSLGNEFGPYGNQFAGKSLFNKFSKYADTLSNTSAFSATAMKPPQVLLKGKMMCYLTVNKNLSPRINPYTAIGYCKYGR